MKVENLLKKYPPLVVKAGDDYPLISGTPGAFVGVIGPAIHPNVHHNHWGPMRENAELRWENGELFIYGKLGWRSFPVRNNYNDLTREQIAHFRHYGRWPGDPKPSRKKAGTAAPPGPVLTKEERDKKLVHDIWFKTIAPAAAYTPTIYNFPQCCGVDVLVGLHFRDTDEIFSAIMGKIIGPLRQRGSVIAAATNLQSDCIPALERAGFRRIGEPTMNIVHYGQTAIQLWQVTYDNFTEKWGLPPDTAQTALLKKWVEEKKL